MWKCYNAVVRQLSSIAISKSPVRFRLLQPVVYVETRPRIGGSVLLLGRRQHFGLPVG